MCRYNNDVRTYSDVIVISAHNFFLCSISAPSYGRYDKDGNRISTKSQNSKNPRAIMLTNFFYYCPGMGPLLPWCPGMPQGTNSRARLPSGLGTPQVCQEHPGSSYLSADTINLEICPAVSSVIPKLSVLAFHSYYLR